MENHACIALPAARVTEASALGQWHKRAFDIALSSIGLVATLPLSVAVACMVAAADGHNPIYRQQRVGLHGKPFTILKFRTMRPDAEADGVQRLCSPTDERVTPIGRWLRRHHIDELPQLWCVLRGDMSIVGHRPERKHYIDQIMAVAPAYERLYALKPGLFSMATLRNGYTYDLDMMLRRLDMDLDYLRHRSMLTDIKITCLCVASVLTGKKF